MNIEIHTFTIDAYDRVFALWQQCDGIGLSQDDSKERIQAYLDRNPGMSFIATADGVVVGAMHDEKQDFRYVGTVTVTLPDK